MKQVTTTRSSTKTHKKNRIPSMLEHDDIWENDDDYNFVDNSLITKNADSKSVLSRSERLPIPEHELGSSHHEKVSELGSSCHEKVNEPASSQNLNRGELSSNNSLITLRSKKTEGIPLNLIKIIKWLEVEANGKKGVWVPCSLRKMKELGVTHRLIFKSREIGKKMSLIDYKFELNSQNQTETFYCLGEETLYFN